MIPTKPLHATTCWIPKVIGGAAAGAGLAQTRSSKREPQEGGPPKGQVLKREGPEAQGPG